MNDLARSLRERLQANRQPITRGDQYAHPRGWNDAFDFIERCIKEITGEGTNAKET